MHILLTEPGGEPFLIDELQRGFPSCTTALLGGGLVQSDVGLTASSAPPVLVFARQTLLDAEAVSADSIRAWSEALLAAIATRVPEGWPWRLHLAPHYGGEGAGANRARFIHEALRELLRKKRRQLLRTWENNEQPFGETTTLVQLLLTAPDAGFLSVAAAPLPWQLRRCVSPFVKGDVPVASDKTAPSRAFAKLIEAERRLGRSIAADELCVDLGACPGSWSYVALQRGARVIAVDRSPVREDLLANARLQFHAGDAFKFQPEAPADWLLCDVIAAPERSIALVLDWLRAGRCRHFIVTIKFKGQADYAKLDALKHALPPLCEEFFLTRLCANKNEACVAGTARDLPKIVRPTS